LEASTLRATRGVAMERIDTKTKISKTFVRGKPRILYAIRHEWRFTEDEIEWIKRAFKRGKDIGSFIQDLQRCCSDKKLSLERVKDPELRSINKRDLERVYDICDETIRCLWAIQGADYLLVDSDQKFVLEAKEKARTAMKSLSPFVWLLANKLFTEKKKVGRKKGPHVNFIKEIIEIYKKRIKDKPTQKELKGIVGISLGSLGLPFEDPSRGLKKALTKLS
jgi:hypothetical protein